jgi:hypothetical protein
MIAWMVRDSADASAQRYALASLDAAFALARHDTTTALRLYERLPHSVAMPRPAWQWVDPLAHALLLAATGRHREAFAVLEDIDEVVSDAPAIGGNPLRMRFFLARGHEAEMLGDTAVAKSEYHYVLNSLAHADPELQPYVQDARAGLSRLGKH